MFFSQTIEYALRAAVWLAGHEGSPRSVATIAEATKVPASYLSKVLQSMRRAEVVVGTRGTRGGFTLARPATRITVLDVVQAVDPIRRIVDCPLGIPSHGPSLCPLHHKLDEALATIAEGFSKTTLADLLVANETAAPLCSLRSSHG
jgi:Rrf2 family transcriptional regulator, nitric oxide-sensitive transcriptional repressor